MCFCKMMIMCIKMFVDINTELCFFLEILQIEALHRTVHWVVTIQKSR